MVTLLSLVLAFITCATSFAQAPADYPVSFDSRLESAPPLFVYQGEPRTFLATFLDGTNRSNVSSVPVSLTWATSTLANAYATSSWAKVNGGTGGQVRFTFAGVDLAPTITGSYYDVKYRAAAGSTYKIGDLRIYRNFGYTGAVTTNFVFPTNLTGVTFSGQPWVESVNFSEGPTNNAVKTGTGLSITFKTNAVIVGPGSSSRLTFTQEQNVVKGQFDDSGLATVGNVQAVGDVASNAADEVIGTITNSLVSGQVEVLQILKSGRILTFAFSNIVTVSTVHTGDVTGAYNNLQISAGVVGTNELNGEVNEVVIGTITNVLVGGQTQLISVTRSGQIVTVWLTNALHTATVFSGDVAGVYTNLQLQANTVSQSNLNDGAVGTDELLDDAVSSDKLAGNAVLSSHISDGEIENADVGASAAIAMSKIAGLAALSNTVVTATGTLATVVASDALKLTSSHWASADSTTNYLPRTGGTMSGVLNMGASDLTNAANVHASGLVYGSRWMAIGNTNTSATAFIGGGQANKNTSTPYSSIVGGEGNLIGPTLASSEHSSIGGGLSNNIQGLSDASTIAGGELNVIEIGSPYSSISGGRNNHIATGSLYCAIAGGADNVASGVMSFVAGGWSNTAYGSGAFAGGRQSRSTNTGSFVWSDYTAANYGSHGDGSVNFRAGGGLWLTETMAFNGSGKLQSGVTTNTGSDGNAMLRSGTNVYWGAPLVEETSTFANVIGRGGQLNAQTLTNINAGAITGTIPASVITASSIATGTPDYVAFTQIVAGALGGTVVSNVGKAIYVSATNFGASGWSGQVATQTVNMAGNAITNLNRIGLVNQTNLVPIRGDLFQSNNLVYFVGASGVASVMYGAMNFSASSYTLYTEFSNMMTNQLRIYSGTVTQNQIGAQNIGYQSTTNIWIPFPPGGTTNWLHIRGNHAFN